MKISAINKGWLLFAIIFAVNILQSLLSPLLNDEAYYWLYAQHPAWGYLDHPPMVAFLINIGSSIFPDEIGVRLIGALFGSLTFFLIYKIIEEESDGPVNFKLAALLLFSSLFLNLYSFLAIPDTPMLFFAVLFLYCYRKYITDYSFLSAVILAVVAALLLYSKYHGILVIGFTLISNPKIVFKKTFYVIFVLAILLYAPHLYWQFKNDFPTIRFQFFQRVGLFKIDYIFSYLGEQAAVTGPLVLLLFSLLYKPENQFQKTLKYIIAGVFGFFFISSFKEMINMHWTAIAFPAMLSLAYLYITKLKTRKKLVTGILIFNLVIVLLFRINFIAGFFRVSNFNDKNPELMTSLLKAKSKGYPLVFTDMYNEPSYYMFYGHTNCFAVNDISYKKTQFNYLPKLEDEFQEKTVALVTLGPFNKSSEEVSIPKGKKYFVTILPNFTSVSSGIAVSAQNLDKLRASAQSIIKVTLKSTLSDTEQARVKNNAPYLLLTFINIKTNQNTSFKYEHPPTEPGDNQFDFPIKVPAEAGTYNCIFSFLTKGGVAIGFNSNIYNCKVE